MHSLARAVLVLLPLGALAASPATPARASLEMTLVVAATTDVHGHLMGWDYYAARPDTARGLTRAATIIDSIRRIPSGTFRARRRRRHAAGHAAHVRCRAQAALSGAPGVRRHERNALRRGGRRKPRVQLRAPLSLLFHQEVRGFRCSPPMRTPPAGPPHSLAVPSWSAAVHESRSSVRRPRAPTRGTRTISSGKLTIGPIIPAVRAQVDSRPPTARRRRCRRDAHRPRRAIQLRHRRITAAERERRGRGGARGAGNRSHRVRALAQANGGHRHRQARC